MRNTPSLARAGGVVANALGLLAGSALFLMMVLTFADVVGRKFIYPIPGVLEISEMLMVVLLFSGLPLVAWHAEHVCFELVDALYKGRSAHWSKRFMDLCCTLAFGLLAIATWRMAGQNITEGEVSSRLEIPIGIFIYLMAVLLAAAALMHLFRVLGAEPAQTVRPEGVE